MRLTEAMRRLDPLPASLPPPTEAIEPRITLSPGARSLPRWAEPGEPSSSSRDAAALVLLFPDAAGEARVVLTERPSQLRHGGQVSLPGGRREPTDDFPVGTALREAAEEVGLDAHAAGVRVLGALDVVDVRVSGFLLTPVLAIAQRAPRLVADPREVAAILEPPLDIFLAGAPITMDQLERDGVVVRYGGFPWEGRHVWGATARVLAQLGAVLSRSTDAAGPPDGP
jgi:8-oxo-dGTP pyrophosphatase MutT (NUDIX family)